MTTRQSLLKFFYPFWKIFARSKKENTISLSNDKNAIPSISFYSLNAIKNDGSIFSFEQLKGKKVLLVNTASDCGYTAQYAELQKLYEQYAESLVILAFPANDFKEQEKESDANIALFCERNYGVTFPLMQKSSVIKSEHQNPIFTWLSDAKQNGWCNQTPSWNFCKYLVNENGLLIHFFASAISPLSNEVKNTILQS
jgi:glutathione peroxidase